MSNGLRRIFYVAIFVTVAATIGLYFVGPVERDHWQSGRAPLRELKSTKVGESCVKTASALIYEAIRDYDNSGIQSGLGDLQSDLAGYPGKIGEVVQSVVAPIIQSLNYVSPSTVVGSNLSKIDSGCALHTASEIKPAGFVASASGQSMQTPIPLSTLPATNDLTIDRPNDVAFVSQGHSLIEYDLKTGAIDVDVHFSSALDGPVVVAPGGKYVYALLGAYFIDQPQRSYGEVLELNVANHEATTLLKVPGAPLSLTLDPGHHLGFLTYLNENVTLAQVSLTNYAIDRTRVLNSGPTDPTLSEDGSLLTVMESTGFDALEISYLSESTLKTVHVTHIAYFQPLEMMIDGSSEIVASNSFLESFNVIDSSEKWAIVLGSPAPQFVLSPDRSFIYVTEDAQVRIYSASTGKQVAVLDTPFKVSALADVLVGSKLYGTSTRFSAKTEYSTLVSLEIPREWQ